MEEKEIKLKPSQCYYCSNKFARNKLIRMKGGDILTCPKCLYDRNRKIARAKVKNKLKKRIIA